MHFLVRIYMCHDVALTSIGKLSRNLDDFSTLSSLSLYVCHVATQQCALSGRAYSGGLVLYSSICVYVCLMPYKHNGSPAACF